MTACARNLPQHFNGCACTVNPIVTAESEVDLTPVPAAISPSERDPFTMTREELLDDPDVRFAPKAWMEEKTDRDLATMVTEMRTARLRAAAEQADIEEARQAEIARRRAYRRPDWLKMDKVNGQRRYSTADEFSGRDLITYSDGRARLIYAVSGPGPGDSHSETEVERVEEMVGWIEEQRAARAQDWTEAFPSTSPASRVAAFRGKPVGRWFDESTDFPDGSASYIAADGSYAWVHEDDEPTGHWFIDGCWADGSCIDGFSDGREESKRQAQGILESGQAAYEAEQESWR